VDGVPEDQDDVFGQPRSNGSFTYPNAQRRYVTYTFLVEGCDRNQDFPKPPTLCRQGWMYPVSVGSTEASPTPPDPSPTPPTPTPPTPVKPTISVSRTTSDGFQVQGSGFKPSTVVHIRIVDDAFTNRWLDQSSTPDGQMTFTTPNLCIFPGHLYFSANDGRPDPGDLTGTLWSNTVTTSCLNGVNTITPSTGGHITTSDGSVRVDFPAQVVTQNTVVTYTDQLTTTHPLSLGSSALRSFSLEAQTSDGQPVTQFQRPYTMTVGYSMPNLAALDMSDASLKLAFWDTTNSHWITVPTNIDTVNHSVTASLDHFTEFVLMGSKLLDDFNRVDGPIGMSWLGRTERDENRITHQQLNVEEGGTVYWQPTAFGTAQEAFVILSKIDPKNSRESLLLKVQGEVPNVRNGAIEVRYYAKDHEVQIQTRAANQNWQVIATIPMTFVNGDQFGARTLVDGKVEVYRNGQLIGTADAGAGFGNLGGRIGLRCTDADEVMLDDFGGGTITP
jgi:hypothetical protein